MFVRWGDTCSVSFCVTNGVKQGGIISPMLFNLYMDDLSLTLNCSGIWGYIGTTLINYLCYVDDLCPGADLPPPLRGPPPKFNAVSKVDFFIA